MNIPPVPAVQVFVFYNPNSGNRQGRHLKDFKGQFIRLKQQPLVQIQMFNILDQNDHTLGFNYLTALHKENKIDIVVCSAGGDGTFVSILEKMCEMKIDISSERLSFSAFPFGTGNDLAQALKWERVIHIRHTKNFDDFCEYILKRLSGKKDKMDIWRVKAETNTTDGTITQSPDIKLNGNLDRMMSNYMSLGVQGVVGYGFERHRHRSRLMNILEYMKQCVKIGILVPIERVPQYFKSIETVEKNRYHLSENCSKRTAEILIGNIPGIWGRQINLWDNCRKKVGEKSILSPCIGVADARNWDGTNMGDGKLDVFTIRSRLDYAVKQVKCLTRFSKLSRMGQFQDNFRINCKEREKFHMMVDGEFYQMYDVSYINVSHVAKINILMGCKGCDPCLS